MSEGVRAELGPPWATVSGAASAVTELWGSPVVSVLVGTRASSSGRAGAGAPLWQGQAPEVPGSLA